MRWCGKLLGMDCVFCRIVAGTADASVVYEDDRLLAFCDLNPVNPGHLLIIPKAHGMGLVDLAESDASRTGSASVLVPDEQLPTLSHTGVWN